MYLQSISILDYKNIEQANFTFTQKLNCFLGDNGAGKTNLLDAIYYLSFTKSFFNSVDSLNIRHTCDMFMLQGKYNRENDDENISIGYKNGQKKQIKRNRKLYKKLSSHIGLIPLVMVSPVDTMLIIGGSDERRKFMDGIISQFDRGYLDKLLRYNRTLLQRNNLLKSFAEKKYFDDDTLNVYDEQLVGLGTSIYASRKQFVQKMIPVFQSFYDFISGGKEEVKLTYESVLNTDDFSEKLREKRQADRSATHTTVGIHKDDLLLELGHYPMKKLGSQGQTKTYLLALKFAQFEYLKKTSNIKPILLLDDIFDKLDAKRVEKIIELVSGDQFGQIFITDTDREHLGGILNKMNIDHKIFKIDESTLKGKIS
jgi:DNA replication and repair protein RecF